MVGHSRDLVPACAEFRLRPHVLPQHMLNKEATLLAAEKGKATALAADPSSGAEQLPDPATGAVAQDDLSYCPICLDEIFCRTITACGHHYCSTCIREVLAEGRRPCPICRTGEWEVQGRGALGFGRGWLGGAGDGGSSRCPAACSGRSWAAGGPDPGTGPPVRGS